MKKILIMLIISSMMLQIAMLTSCSGNNEAKTVVETVATTEKKVDMEDNNGVGYNILEDGTLEVANAGNAKKIVVPEEHNGKKVTSIGKSAFKMTKATSITLPDTITTIESFAFGLSTKLEEINIPEGVTSIEANAFNGCLSLKEIKLPNSLETIGIFAFDACAFTEVEIPENIELIDEFAFAECSKLKKVIFKNNNVDIKENVFNRSNKVVIHGKKDSTAIKYAKAHGINYKVL